MFLIRKYSFCVNLIQKFKRVILRWNLVRRSPPSSLLINFSIFLHPEHSFSSPSPPSTALINYCGKFSTRVWNDILMLTFLQSRKRSGPSVVWFVLQVNAKFFFVSYYKEANLIANWWHHLAEVIEFLLIFLLNVLLDFTGELDVFCWLFAIQSTSASLYSILKYQIKFLLPHPYYQISIFPTPHPLFIQHPPPLFRSIRYSRVD